MCYSLLFSVTKQPFQSISFASYKYFLVAEDWVNRTNTQLGPDMYKQWAQIPLWGINQEKPVQCIPIRYALSGVYIHCNTQALNTSGLQVVWFRDHFGINTDSEFNAFLVELPAIALSLMISAFLRCRICIFCPMNRSTTTARFAFK